MIRRDEAAIEEIDLDWASDDGLGPLETDVKRALEMGVTLDVVGFGPNGYTLVNASGERKKLVRWLSDVYSANVGDEEWESILDGE